MFFLVEFRCHAALALDALFESDAGQLPCQVVGPAVIHATEFFDVALSSHTQEVTAMDATIDESVDIAVDVLRDQHRYFAYSR